MRNNKSEYFAINGLQEELRHRNREQLHKNDGGIAQRAVPPNILFF